MTAGASSSGKSLDERLRFVKHKGHAIFVIDFSHCTAKEMMLLLDQVRADIARHAPSSVLTLDRPYVKRSAWVGTESLPHVFYEHFRSFSQREFPTFKTREEAMDWLVAE